jgi:hypothetical protein
MFPFAGYTGKAYICVIKRTRYMLFSFHEGCGGMTVYTFMTELKNSFYAMMFSAKTRKYHSNFVSLHRKHTPYKKQKDYDSFL